MRNTHHPPIQTNAATRQHALNVYWQHSSSPTLVGTLTQTHGQINFCYAPSWLAQANNPSSHHPAQALSISLPLQAAPFNDAQTRPFFAGLLPEGRLRQLLAKQIHISQKNDFALLQEIGGECAGALTFLPTTSSADDSNRPNHTETILSESNATATVRWLNQTELSDIIATLPQRPMLAGEDGLRLSLAGAQDKLPVVIQHQPHASFIGLPQHGQASTHILKPAITGVANSVLNEAFCLALARAMGLPAAEATLWHLGVTHCLLVRRYDRNPSPTNPLQIERLHQEDFCQALGIVPEMKYQNEGGPDLAACFALVRQATRPPATQVLQLLDYVIFNTLIGNHDAHAKNFSLLYPQPHPTHQPPVLAPLYDVLCTAIYPELSDKMAMKIGSKYLFKDLQTRHWDQFAESANLAPALTRKRLQHMASHMLETATTLQHAAPYADHPVAKKIVAVIKERTASFTNKLN